MMEKYITDERTGLKYELVGDYYLVAGDDEPEEDHPILVDDYLDGRECDVDAICDGKDVLLPGIMEHIEHAGVHSGDSMAVYPPQTFTEEVKEKITDVTRKLALTLHCVGIMNIQFYLHVGLLR